MHARAWTAALLRTHAWHTRPLTHTHPPIHPHTHTHTRPPSPHTRARAHIHAHTRTLAHTYVGATSSSAGQAPGLLHDPEEDCRAVLDLYRRYVEPSRISDYGQLVQHYTQQALAQAQEVRGREAEQ